jgi:hypothetical protein
MILSLILLSYSPENTSYSSWQFSFLNVIITSLLYPFCQRAVKSGFEDDKPLGVGREIMETEGVG